MAVRLFPIRFTGGVVTTARSLSVVLIGGLLALCAAPAQAQWDDEPAASVLVEGGLYGGDETTVDDWQGGRGGELGDGSFAVGDYAGFGFGGSSCSSCAGYGCDHCGRTALIDHCGHHKKACWIGRVDALILWRNAPPDRPLIDNGLVTGPLLNANGLDSTAAAGPRFSVFRVNNCTGHAIEATYLRAANFRSMRPLSAVSEPYVLAPPGIYGDELSDFETGNANLGSRLQSFEFNRHHCKGKFIRFLAGFRWIEWAEQFSFQGTPAGGLPDAVQTGGYNSLYGGQIGVDANLLALSWIRFDSVIKAGAFYNNAVMRTNIATTAGNASFAVADSPASGAFAGELGFTGVMPLTRSIDFRFGYFGLWLSGIAQPTQQLSAPAQPAADAINTNGGVVLQGVSLGLEGRW